jgi:RNA polymerase sigma-70 factor (ECF subfamily)
VTVSRVVPLRRPVGAPSEMSDEALVAACATGENVALAALFDRHGDPVRRFLCRMSGTDDRDVDDLVQTTFEAVPRAAARFAGRSTVRSWLFGVANNAARHHIRSEVRRRRALAAVAEAARISPATDEPDRERSAMLRDAIAALPPKLREAFVLVYLEEVPGRDAARALGVREGTLWKRLHQARARLRELLGGARP